MAIDVIVIGAGPAGTAAGLQVAREGYEVLIIDKDYSSGKNKALGAALPRKCFDDLELPTEIIGAEIHSLVYHFQNEEIPVSSSPGFGLFDRSTLDRLLLQKAKESGAKVLNSTLVPDVARCDDCAIVRYRKLPKGKLLKSLARIVVFADGPSTLAHSKFQLGFDSRPEGTALGATYELKYPKNALDSMDFFFSEEVSPFGYGWIFPRKDTINVGVKCLISRMKHNIRRYLDDFVSSVALSSREIAGYYSCLMPQSYVERLYGDSILVAGDAAGTCDPIDGGGISNAIASGRIAGKVAVEALEAGSLTADFLAKYKEEWEKTENYRLFHRSYLLQRLAYNAGVNIGVLLKQIVF